METDTDSQIFSCEFSCHSCRAIGFWASEEPRNRNLFIDRREIVCHKYSQLTDQKMEQNHKNCENSHLKPKMENGRILKRISKAANGLICFPFAQYAVQKLEEFLEILENFLNRPTPQTKNNFRQHVNDLKSTYEKDTVRLQENNHTPLIWILLIIVVLAIHFCHFYVNITLFMMNRPPVEFQDIRWSLQKSRLRLKDMRKKGSKEYRRHQKLVAQRLAQHPPQPNILCQLFTIWPLKLFIKRLKRILNFLGIITIPLQTDLKKSIREEKYGVTDILNNTTLLTRRVSVTVQEIIFEEVEDSLGNFKETANNHLKTTNYN